MPKIRKIVTIFLALLSLYSLSMMSSPVAHATSCTIGSSSNIVEGCIVDYDTGTALSGMDVWLIACGTSLTQHTTTDTTGHFSFTLPCSLPNWGFPLSVNGVTSQSYGYNCPSGCHYLGY